MSRRCSFAGSFCTRKGSNDIREESRRNRGLRNRYRSATPLCGLRSTSTASGPRTAPACPRRRDGSTGRSLDTQAHSSIVDVLVHVYSGPEPPRPDDGPVWWDGKVPGGSPTESGRGRRRAGEVGQWDGPSGGTPSSTGDTSRGCLSPTTGPTASGTGRGVPAGRGSGPCPRRTPGSRRLGTGRVGYRSGWGPIFSTHRRRYAGVPVRDLSPTDPIRGPRSSRLWTPNQYRGFRDCPRSSPLPRSSTLSPPPAWTGSDGTLDSPPYPDPSPQTFTDTSSLCVSGRGQGPDRDGVSEHLEPPERVPESL